MTGLLLLLMEIFAKNNGFFLQGQPRYAASTMWGGSLGLTLREALKTSGGKIQYLWYFTIAFMSL